MTPSRPGWRALVTGMLFMGGVLSGCAGKPIRDGVYVDEAKGFRVRVPRNGWQVVDARGADLAFRDVPSEARVAVWARCPEPEAGPLTVLARHLFFGLRQVEWLRQGEILVDGVAGLETVVKGQFEGVPMQVRSVVIRRKGCLYDLLLVAPPETFGAQDTDFDHFLKGWQFLSDSP